jgi:CO/xanthine dehydrogenase FAD-binding subunit
MRPSVSSLDVIRCRSLDQALDALHEHGGSLVPLAGCTDLYVALNAGTLAATRFLDIWPLDELRGIEMDGGTLRLGALATYQDVLGSAHVRAHLPMLVEAARQVGAVQIQQRGTLGGNVVNASPAGDTLPVFAAADAVVVLQSVRGARQVPFTAFYTGYRATVRQPDELVVRIDVPPVPGRQWFRKVGTRAAQAISKVVIAAVRGGRPRIALGSVAPVVVRAWRTEEALASGASMAEAQARLASEISPIDDIRSSAAYRLRVSQNLLARFWSDTAPDTERVG